MATCGITTALRLKRSGARVIVAGRNGTTASSCRACATRMFATFDQDRSASMTIDGDHESPEKTFESP